MIRNLSHSSLALYSECPKKWEYQYIDRRRGPRTPPLVIGDAIHRSIRTLVEARLMDISLDEGAIDAIWADHWQAAVNESGVDWRGDFPETHENAGLRTLTAAPVLAAIEALEPASGAAFERKISLSVPGVPVPVIGYIDLLTIDNVVVDFKTSGRKWTPERAQMEMQPLYYLAALNQETGEIWSQFRHLVMTTQRTPQVQVLDTVRTMDEMFGMFTFVRESWARIEAGEFPQNEAACHNWGRPCDFYADCWGQQ